ncbi:hypothetical protein A4X09_0g7737 [Tilletia walkeri]|uniref:Uncharacterized protein n=1 Tax=Tilletia walkeri TaxID=117179 RepID=A0A8X7N2Q6_9BASI|nr:hypothetical protein A4X09_0g7737 [Tilletia walkeri]
MPPSDIRLSDIPALPQGAATNSRCLRSSETAFQAIQPPFWKSSSNSFLTPAATYTDLLLPEAGGSVDGHRTSVSMGQTHDAASLISGGAATSHRKSAEEAMMGGRGASGTRSSRSGSTSRDQETLRGEPGGSFIRLQPQHRSTSRCSCGYSELKLIEVQEEQTASQEQSFDCCHIFGHQDIVANDPSRLPDERRSDPFRRTSTRWCYGRSTNPVRGWT